MLDFTPGLTTSGRSLLFLATVLILGIATALPQP